MGYFRCHSLEIKFSLVMSSPGGPGINAIQHHGFMVVTLSIFGARTKIALTGVRSRVRESLASRLF